MADVSIRRGENPSLLCDFTESTLDVSTFDETILTIWQGGTVDPDVKITKKNGAAKSTYVLKVDLTEAETLSLVAGKTTQLQVKMRIGTVVVESAITPVDVYDDLNNETMGG